MSFGVATDLPNDIVTLKAMVLSYQQQTKDLDKKYHEQKNKAAFYHDQLQILKKKLFGRSSEKLTQKEKDQLWLFNEIEQTIAEKKQEQSNIQVKGHIRKKKSRKPFPKDIPRKTVVHDLTEEKKIHECGKKMKLIREEKSEKLNIIPETMEVIEHITRIYACECEGLNTEESAIKSSSLPPQIIPRSIATPGLLAYILTAKFCDSLPFYRQEKMFLRRGIELSRQNMSSWAMQIYERYGFIQNIMRHDMLHGNFIGMDETTVQVLSEGDRKNTTKSYMWVANGKTSDKPVVLYNYFPTRSADFVLDFLKDYSGYVQCDGFSAYTKAEKELNIKLAGCWAHARRKYTDVVKTAKNSKALETIIDYIAQLYKIEKQAREEAQDPDEILDLRQKYSKPVIEKLFEYIQHKSTEVPPKSLFGSAMQYTLNEWDKLVVFLENGSIPIDNNLVENKVRPFVLGRKNWLFSGCPHGADASAFLFSLIETAKANGLESYFYLFYLFHKLPYAKTDEDIRVLLPYNLDNDTLMHFFKECM